MKLDPIRLASQEKGFDFWRKGKEINGILKQAVGIIEACTGWGKTYLMVLAIKFMNNKNPDRFAIVIVPTTKLLEDWNGYTDSTGKFINGHIQNHNLKNLRVFIINTFVKYKNWECDLLCIDEVHRICNEDSQFFSTVLSITKFKFFLGCSATLSKKEKEFLAKFNIPIVFTVTEEEAKQNGYIAPSSIYNVAIPLSEKDKEFNDKINEKFKFYFGRFQHEFDLVKACNAPKGTTMSVRLRNGTYLGKKTASEWIKELARVNNYNNNSQHPYSPENISRNAAQCMAVIYERKNMWQNFPSKLDYAVNIINKFPRQTLVFCETSAFADKLAILIPNISVCYHTNLETIAIKGQEQIILRTDKKGRIDKDHKEELKKLGYEILGNAKRKSLALKRFLDPNDSVRVMITVRAMDEGVDVPSVSMTLQCAYSSKARQGTQRRGRGGRIDYEDKNKKTLNICLYMEGTQEEKWLRSSQEGKIVINVKDINDININDTISLGSNEQDTEIIIEESDIESGISRNNSD